ncbi:hypothetical protein [Pseudomonas putida]|uniref:hypothetical protein n=1 Tax=Pseudomonas putida TaxID=303 RepID=UPI0039E1CFB1
MPQNNDAHGWIACDDGLHLIQMDKNLSHYGWVFRKVDGGLPYSVREATPHEMAHAQARQHLRIGVAQIAGQAPAPQPHPEPIAWMVGTAFWWTKEEAERDAAAMGLPVVGLGPMTGSAPAEQHQGDAIGTLVRDYNERIVFTPIGDPHIIDDMKVYAHADPREVERLRAEIEEWNRIFDMQEGKIDAIRAQLVERDALLREIRRKPGLFSGDFILRLDETLSANAEPRPFRIPDCPDCACVQDGQCLCSPSKPSAEPSAPVECDERALIELALSEYGKATGNHVLPGGFNDKQDEFVQGFLCRAALERKP